MEESERTGKLQQLVDYGLSSSESESDGEFMPLPPRETKSNPVSVEPSPVHASINIFGDVRFKRHHGQTDEEQQKKQKTLKTTKEQQQTERNDETKETLPIPSGILKMFESDGVIDEQDHDGRVRSFAHVPGNWATHVFIKVQVQVLDEFELLVSSLVQSLPDLLQPKMHVMARNDVHLSLSRTVPIRHYWIDPLVEQLKSKLETKERFLCVLGSPQFYVNDDRTRSFLGLTVCTGREQLSTLVNAVDDVFKEFALQEFYKKPSFHASIAWCLGDVFSQCGEPLPQPKESFDCLMSEDNALSILVSEVLCKIGNRMYSFPLLAV